MRTKKMKFISILSNPETEYSVKEIASKIKVSEKTINKWMADPEILNEAFSRYISIVGSRLPKVLKKLLSNAETGDVNSIKLILMLTKSLQDLSGGKEYLTTDKALNILDEYFEGKCKNCLKKNFES